MHTALAQLTEQDPLINLRQDDGRGVAYVSLYGEVQKEVIAQTLAADLGIEIEFLETTTICIERVGGVGHAVQRLGQPPNRYLATVGLCVEPGDVGGGVAVTLDVDLVTIPLYIYKTVDAFRDSMCDYVRTTLQRGARDGRCPTVTSHSPSARTTRRRRACATSASSRRSCCGWHCEMRARSCVNRSTASGSTHLPTAFPGCCSCWPRLRAVPDPPALRSEWLALTGEIPAAEVPRLRQRLHGLTSGEGVLEVAFDRYEPR